MIRPQKTHAKISPKEILFHLNDSSIKSINADLFKNNDNLEIINLSGSNIQSICKNTFKGLINLETIYLSKNKLKEINEEVFKSLKNLKLLKLDNNEIEQTAWLRNTGLINLNEIYFTNNKIEDIDFEIFLNLKNLNLIDLSHNLIKKIDLKIILPHKKLSKIYLSFNQIGSFELILFERIEFVDISNNQPDSKPIRLKLAGLKFIQSVNEITLDKIEKVIDKNLMILSKTDNIRSQLYKYKNELNKLENIDIDTVLEIIESRKVDCCLYKMYQDNEHMGLAFRLNEDIFVALDPPKISTNFFIKLFKTPNENFIFSLRDNTKFSYKFGKTMASFTLNEDYQSKIREMFENLNNKKNKFIDKVSDNELDNNLTILFKIVLFVYLSQEVTCRCDNCGSYLKPNNNGFTFHVENMKQEIEKHKKILLLENQKEFNQLYQEFFKNQEVFENQEDIDSKISLIL